MLKNYLIIAFRIMRKNKLDTILNLIGISLGLALSILIIFHIQDELSYDHHFSKAERIFRISCEVREGNNVRHWATTSPVIPDYISQVIPEVEKTCRLFVIPSQIISYFPENEPSRQFKESSGFFADQTSIDLFDLKFISGDSKTALTEVNSIVLTQSTADKFFPNENPLGKMLVMGNSSNKPENLLKVTGVIQNLPSNTHFNFAYLVSFPTFYVFLRGIGQEQLAQAKTWAALYNYVLLKNQNLITNVEAKLPDFAASYFQERDSREKILSRIQFHFQPIVDIHLHSKLEQEFETNSDIIYVYIFAAVAFFILLIVAVNYINIIIAQALKRQHEIGLRKVLGIQRAQLVSQTIIESFLYIFIAVYISLFLIELFLPFYNTLSGKSYDFMNVFHSTNILIFLATILLFGCLASFYPIIFIARLNPIQSLLGIRDPLSLAARSRKALVILQFTISTFMIFVTLITFQQMTYLQKKNLGFDKENIIAIQLNNDLQQMAINNPEILKNELMKNPTVLATSIVSNIPGDRFSVEPLQVEGAPDIDERGQFRFIRVDQDYVRTMKLNLSKGRDFSDVSENMSAFIINERAAQLLQLNDPIGRIASSFFGTSGEIVGVVQDFHFASLHEIIEPLVIEHFPQSHQLRAALTPYMLVRIEAVNIQTGLQSIRKTIEQIAPGSLFTYSFLDENLNLLYQSERRMRDLFRAFAFFAIFISCLGLFGLASFSVQLRTKEIGIRKTLGASLFNIIHLIANRFVVWILVANLIALPLGWIYVSNWLHNFAYRTQISSFPFLVTILISVAVTSLVVSYHVFGTARANPVQSLRCE